ncbi:MAG: penicillin-binding protein 1C [candidate division Zixibacteria bacterium RBG_16_53_22]|nr:MAG: penicillin-binding protein 1C [candidate division Zixibacteria bacterium RBG_16_53_22]
MSAALGRRLIRGSAVLFAFLTVLILLDALVFPLPMANLRKPSARFVYSRERYLLAAFAASDTYWRKPVALADISPLLQSSVIACEDRWFYYHPGVNPISLFMAAIDNIKAGKVVRGGSTITMQVARMMEPKPRTVASKLVEIVRAFQLELHFSKREILESYFNLAPYGGNLEGVGAASYFYFAKTPLALTASEAALLTSIPNSPSVLRPDLNFEKSLRARDRVLGVMLQRQIISKGKYDEAFSENVVARKHEQPFLAPHFTRHLADSGVPGPEIESSLSLRIQAACEGIIANHRPELAARGIANAAVVVLQNSSAEVLAMVGSADFFDGARQGQVNGTTSPRSPGSALKPFVYAMALDKGLISPNKIVEDLPVYYSGYSPENYDRKYRGAVSAAEALRLSLNVPAVWACSKVGQREFCRLLRTGGITTLTRNDQDYGLPIILGSCEIRLLDLATLYSALARQGSYIPYKLIRTQSGEDTVRLFTPEASYIISEILTELQRPDFPSSWEFSPDIPRVAWKTGTSYGRKDAWSVGYNPEFTVGVWAGNFAGEPSPDLVGTDIAAPMLFEIFEVITRGRDDAWFEMPQGVGTRDVCAVSGMIPTGACHATISELFIPGVSPTGPCNIHKEIMVDLKSGHRLCRYCTEGNKATHVMVEDWPAKIATWLVASGRAISSVPVHNPDCTGMPQGDRPLITSPNDDALYVIRKHVPIDLQRISLEASAAAGANFLYWFVDGELFTRAEIGQRVFYEPEPGAHNLTCTDDAGRSSSLIFHVE